CARWASADFDYW
nr:immunoglobulin heavy chain junction region [Macaca mulatta]MOV38613.1 immunoglobulin heavy chain junction region [Macaca mulatta]MOV38648.1 immunoglobulin heavy chain junction region [Macaca mulatta]MOV39828.1 immunoglobulin heavy chain junction region [Macaca mulatta]MOV40383.1 immunoglobulin heavy chain junction region [Macaca mulatta]